MMPLRKLALAALIAPLALGLASCDSAEDAATGEVPEAAPIAPIAAPQNTQWADTVTVTPEDGYVIGNPDAPIKLMEYASLTCGHCAQFSGEASADLREKYVNSGRVSYEMRNQVHNGIDLVLGRMVRCSAPESFHALSEQVWANLETLLGAAQANPQGLEAAMQLPEAQRFPAVAEVAGLYDFFAARGVSEDQARTCLADFASVQKIADNSQKQSEELNVTGTPTFFINGKNVGTQSWDTLEPMLQRAGAR